VKEWVLEVSGLTVVRDRYTAVESVSFSIPTGTNTAIVGPNGAGKSTLIQAILGILPRQSGDIQILGRTLTARGKLPKSVRKAIAYLPQNFMFDRRLPMTVEEMVGLGWDDPGLQWPWAERQARRQAIRQALAQVEAIHLKDQRLSELSGGEMKRALLAYCLVKPRRLLILDEAPAGLDAKRELEFYQLLYNLQRQQGWAILQVSHDLNMVQRQCDHVICLNQRLLCEGEPDIALAPESLSLAYGADFVRYHHSCHPSPIPVVASKVER
jgi:zinc transport system ATP-binding protein